MALDFRYFVFYKFFFFSCIVSSSHLSVYYGVFFLFCFFLLWPYFLGAIPFRMHLLWGVPGMVSKNSVLFTMQQHLLLCLVALLVCISGSLAWVTAWSVHFLTFSDSAPSSRHLGLSAILPVWLSQWCVDITALSFHLAQSWTFYGWKQRESSSMFQMNFKSLVLFHCKPYNYIVLYQILLFFIIFISKLRIYNFLQLL